MPATIRQSTNVLIGNDNIVDWSRGDIFYKISTTSETFTFSNTSNGKSISVIIKNNTASVITITMPTSLVSGVLNYNIQAGKEGMFIIVKSNDKFYLNSIVDMV